MNANNFVLTTLSQNPEYFEEVIHLIEEEFHYHEDHNYEKDFAPLVNPFNFDNCFLYIEKETNTVAGHLAICIRSLVKENIETSIALIGGIVTNKKYRHQKIFHHLMKNAINAYKDHVSLFILWSDIEGLYEKYFFYRTGGIIETGQRILQHSDRPSGYEKTNFSLLSKKDFEKIIHLYKNFNEKYFLTIKRENQHWSIIKEMSSIDLYLKRNDKGEIKKYFCINKGCDLTNIIHEISCLNLDEYSSMLKDLEEYKVWLPETEINKTKTISTNIFYTAFIKLGNQEILNNFLSKISKNELVIKKIDEHHVQFIFKKSPYEASLKDFLQYIFGPKPLEEFVPYKLSLYIAGMDSV